MKKVACALSATIAGILLLAGYSFGSAAAREPTAKEAPSVKTAISTVSTSSHAHAASAETTTPNNKTPEGLLALLGERIKAKDLKGIIALHEPEAAVVLWDLSVIRGPAEIRAMYVEWFKLDPVLTVNPRQTVVAGGERGPDGKVHGRTASIMGKWLYLQGNPYPPHGGTHS